MARPDPEPEAPGSDSFKGERLLGKHQGVARRGGHNILEPAAFGKPIVFGPYAHNFREITDAFVAHDAAIQVNGARGLEEALLALMTDPVRRARLGAAARALVDSNRGAKDKSLAIIAQLLPLRGGAMGVVRPFRAVN